MTTLSPWEQVGYLAQTIRIALNQLDEKPPDLAGVQASLLWALEYVAANRPQRTGS